MCNILPRLSGGWGMGGEGRGETRLVGREALLRPRCKPHGRKKTPNFPNLDVQTFPSSRFTAWLCPLGAAWAALQLL